MVSKNLNLLVLPGDGIGPEVTGQAVLVLEKIAEYQGLQVELEYASFGGVSIIIGIFQSFGTQMNFFRTYLIMRDLRKLRGLVLPQRRKHILRVGMLRRG